MAKNLLIVESPAKAKTIEKILGSDFEVRSCFGHIRDLEKDDMGIDVNNNYLPRYKVPDEKEKVVRVLLNGLVPVSGSERQYHRSKTLIDQVRGWGGGC